MKEIKEFYSKRNKVTLVEIQARKYIHKVYLNEVSFLIEKNFYFNVKQNEEYLIEIPKLISCEENQKVLLLEYIEGKTLLEKLEELEKINDIDAEIISANLIISLYDWIDRFYKMEFVIKKGLVLNDINFRNFIVKDNKIYGIDFEDISKVSHEYDKEKIIAFYLTYSPCFTSFKNRVRKRVEDYLVYEKGINRKTLLNNIEEQLNIIQKRRKSITK